MYGNLTPLTLRKIEPPRSSNWQRQEVLTVRNHLLKKGVKTNFSDLERALIMP